MVKPCKKRRLSASEKNWSEASSRKKLKVVPCIAFHPIHKVYINSRWRCPTTIHFMGSRYVLTHHGGNVCSGLASFADLKYKFQCNYTLVTVIVGKDVQEYIRPPRAFSGSTRLDATKMASDMPYPNPAFKEAGMQLISNAFHAHVLKQNFTYKVHIAPVD